MTRFGGFLCFMFISLPEQLQNMLYILELDKAKLSMQIFYIKIFLFYTFPCILEYHNSN